jgi:murein DD-endopeptidase MepM/ murein hydrolase activator NlpD
MRPNTDQTLPKTRQRLLIVVLGVELIVVALGFSGLTDSAVESPLPLGNTSVDTAITNASPATDLSVVNFADASDSLAHEIERMASAPSIMPVAGPLSSQFALRRYHPILQVFRPHSGVDVSARMGAPIVAAAAGTVMEVVREQGYGLLVRVDHGRSIETIYAHLSRALVRPGEHVSRGQIIANVGSSGLTTGPHLHFEIRVAGKAVDPREFLTFVEISH